MTIEFLPKFTPDAAKLWATIPAETRKQLLSNVWCEQCQHEVTITNYSGADTGDNILLVGKCSICQSDISKVIETSS